MKKSRTPLFVVSVLFVCSAPFACGGSNNNGTGGASSSSTTSSSHASSTHASSTAQSGQSSVQAIASSGSGGGPQHAAACDAPTTAPSKGACFKPSGTGGAGGMMGGTGGTGGAGTGGAGTGGAGTGGKGAGGKGAGGKGTGGAGGGPDCTGVLNPGACDTCMEASCCAEIATCKADANCIPCLAGQVMDPNVCGMGATKMAIDGFTNCQNAKCAKPCTPAECNPVTGEGCDIAKGATCDIDGQTGKFVCFPAPNDVMLCGDCDNTNGPFCQVGGHCIARPDMMTFECAEYCCDDGDCGSGKCDKTLLKRNDVGVCVVK